MKDVKVEKRRQRRLGLFFILAVFGILVGTLGLLAVAMYILLNLGIIQVSTIDIEPWLLIFILLVASIIMGTIISFVVSRFVFRAAYTVASAMDELASGDFSKRIDLGNNQESKQLTESFNKLAEELENTKMLRSDFINEFAHEFKTPIVSIKGFAELLQKENLSDVQKKEYISVIIEESERLSMLAVNSLYLSKIEKQSILTEITKFNVSEQIRASILLLENKWVDKDLELSLEFDEYELCGNEELLKQVWINLIDNAIKFSDVRGTLGIEISEKQGSLFVSVTNGGKTLTEEEKEKIFEKFYRADNSHQKEGNGVGLAIVKKIVDLHKGRIEVQSNTGRTTFTVILPKAKTI